MNYLRNLILCLLLVFLGSVIVVASSWWGVAADGLFIGGGWVMGGVW